MCGIYEVQPTQELLEDSLKVKERFITRILEEARDDPWRVERSTSADTEQKFNVITTKTNAAVVKIGSIP